MSHLRLSMALVHANTHALWIRMLTCTSPRGCFLYVAVLPLACGHVLVYARALGLALAVGLAWLLPAG